MPPALALPTPPQWSRPSPLPPQTAYTTAMSRRRPTTTAAPAVAPLTRRERILAAAIAAFARGGFQGASTREIAEEAGVTDPLLFYYFKSKADLYLEAVQSQLATLSAGIDGALRDVDDPRERLARFVQVYLRYFIDLEPGLTVTLRELNGLPRPAADAIAAAHQAGVSERLESILVDGAERGVFRALDVDACTYGIIAILQGFIRYEARAPGRFSRAQVEAQVLQYYLPGLLAPPSA